MQAGRQANRQSRRPRRPRQPGSQAARQPGSRAARELARPHRYNLKPLTTAFDKFPGLACFWGRAVSWLDLVDGEEVSYTT